MTQVEKKAQPYLPFIPISGNSPHRKSTLEVHGTTTDPHYGISPMWGSSLGPGGPQPYTLTKPCHLLLLCTFSRPCQAHLSLLQTFVCCLNPLFLRSPSQSIPNTLSTIHPLNQPTFIHSFHMTKPSKHTFIYSLIHPFFHTIQLCNTFIPHFINSSHT